jgi:arylsulfatase A-like enzyme
MKRSLASLLLTWVTLSAAQAEKQPNILMIVIDDLGYGDLSAHGHPWLKTPNLDRLHDESVRMTDFMVSPTCAPTRAALMTGAHEFRSGVTHTIPPMRRMNRECVTLPQILATAGYRTGMFGKWHLGISDGHAPWDRGFHEAVIAETDADQRAHMLALDPVFSFNGERREMQGVREFLFADEAMRFMKEKREEPFFCYLATHDPHKAYWAENRFELEMERQVMAAREAGILGVSDRRLPFFAEILQLDWNLGRILDFLEFESLAENTLVVLISDNGGTDGVDAHNANMRGHKTTAWVGGTRAIAFWRLPGILETRALTPPFAHIDVLPTLAEVAGATLDDRAQSQIEGRSAWGILNGSAHDWPERTLFAHVARWNPGEREKHRYEGVTVRRGNFDLVRIATSNAGRAYTERPGFHRAATPGGGWALYDRHADPRQEHDVSAAHPELANRLATEFEAWWDASRQFLIHEP